jgi:hypothetical protein
MKSPEFIRAKLVNRTNADCSSHEAKNNRYHYQLRFEESIGFDLLETQVNKCSHNIGIQLELWKIRPSGVSDFEVEVREVSRREGIDDGQRGLDSFER